jgi:hypothetical protein
MMSPAVADDLDARIQLDMAGEHFFWIRKDGEVRIGRGAIDEPDLVLRGTPSEIAGFVYAGEPLASIGMEGDARLAARLPSLFPFPEKAQLTAA